MKYLRIIEFLLFITAVVFIFINWKIAIIIFSLQILVRVFPEGPHKLLNTLSGLLIIGGGVYLFFDWRIGVVLIVCGFLVAKFHLWGNRKNLEYYSQQDQKTEDEIEKEI